MQKEIFPGVWQLNEELATKNLVPGARPFDEAVRKVGKDELRIWDPTRSKLAAAIRKGLHFFPKQNSKILYLGAANGYTSSFLSDAVGAAGVIYAVEFSARPTRDLLRLAASRINIAPILEDARLPDRFAPRIEKVDIIYEDVAQKDQAEIMIRNASLFLKADGRAMIAIKARSIDVTKKPYAVFAEQRKILERFFVVEQFLSLEPYERDHAFFVCRPK